MADLLVMAEACIDLRKMKLLLALSSYSALVLNLPS